MDDSLILCSKESSRALEQQRDQGRSSSGSESARVVEDDTSRSHEGVDGDAIVQDFREGISMGETLNYVVQI